MMELHVGGSPIVISTGDGVDEQELPGSDSPANAREGIDCDAGRKRATFHLPGSAWSCYLSVHRFPTQTAIVVAWGEYRV